MEAAGKVMAGVLGWDAPRRRREIEEAIEEISSVEAASSAARVMRRPEESRCIVPSSARVVSPRRRCA
mgnify:CR=1 FL=1